MELNFIKVFDRWVAEFTATEDFNIHIEGVKLGNLSIFQKGTENGGYAFVNGAVPTPSAGTVYDCDFSATIYPKYMKVSCATEPTYAVVTSGTDVVVNEVVPENLDFKFKVNMEETDNTVNGEVEGNFNGTYNTVAAFAKNYGTVEDYGYSVKDEDTLNKVDMKINSYDVTEVEYHESDEYIKMQTDALSSNEADGSAVLRMDKVSFAYALPKEEPEVPEDDGILTYAFNIPNMKEVESDFGIGTYYIGTSNDDFSEIRNKIIQPVETFGSYEDWGYGIVYMLDNDTTRLKTNITVNGYRVEWIDYYKYNGQLVLGLANHPHPAIGEEPMAYLTETSIQANLPAAWNPDAPKPESDVIEYHFEIPMEYDFSGYAGSLDGDFSELHNKLESFITSKGSNEGDMWSVGGELLSNNVNVTANDDKVTSIEFYPDSGEMICWTTRETGLLTLTTGSANYEYLLGSAA